VMSGRQSIQIGESLSSAPLVMTAEQAGSD
jgi:hypothetical protein